jgi:hypothetical protein
MEFIPLTFDKVQLHSSAGSKRFALNDFLESLLIFSTFPVYLSKITVAIANPQISRAIALKLLAFQYLSKVLSIQCGFETLSLKANFCSFLLLKQT